MRAGITRFAHTPSYSQRSFETRSKRELGIEIPKNTKLKWGGLLTEEHLTYAGDDIRYLADLHESLCGVLDKHKVRDRYEAIRDSIPDFIGASVRGIPLDADRLQPILDAYAGEVGDLWTQLEEYAPDHPEGGTWVWGNTNKNTGPT